MQLGLDLFGRVKDNIDCEPMGDAVPVADYSGKGLHRVEVPPGR